MSEEISRLKKLLEHWIIHNEEHTARFVEATNDAIKIGLIEVSNNIKIAAEKGNEVTKYLQRALDSINQN